MTTVNVNTLAYRVAAALDAVSVTTPVAAAKVAASVAAKDLDALAVALVDDGDAAWRPLLQARALRGDDLPSPSELAEWARGWIAYARAH